MVELRIQAWPRRQSIAILLLMCAACTEGKSEKAGSPVRIAAARVATLAVNPEFLGHLLYDTYQEHAADSTGTRETAIQTADAAIKDRCDLPYAFVVIPGRSVAFPIQQIPLAGRDSTMVYAIADAGSDKLVLGRHYRVEVDSSGRTVRSAVASTNDCLAMSNSELADAGAIVHNLSDGPTEFHVFLSLLHETSLRVRTPSGLWIIDRGKVHLARPNPNYRPEEPGLVSCGMPGGWTMTTTEASCRSNGGTIIK